jgi:adenylyl-sulfate kinase
MFIKEAMPEKNLFPYHHFVNQAMRSALNGHAPLVIWLTGYSGSGKSTLAGALEAALVEEYHAHTYLLDGDNVRTGLNAGLGFSAADRQENIRRIGEVAKLMVDAGLIVITAFISPYRADRDSVRALFPAGSFWEVYVSCPLPVCMQRDPKGLYRKALKGEISDFTGVDSPYEEPLAPEMRVDTEKMSVAECVQQILAQLVAQNIVNGTRERE